MAKPTWATDGNELPDLVIHDWDKTLPSTAYYRLECSCYNCGYRCMGLFIKSYGVSGSYKCPNCECRDLRAKR